MIPYPEIDPVIVSFGPLALRWYGLTYLAGFLFAWWYGRRRAAAQPACWRQDELSDMVFQGALGAILGGRIGYVLFYGFDRLLADPVFLVRIWEGGMSFHGGLIGVATAMFLYGRSTGRPFLQVTDFAAPLVPVGLGFGRLGNFINAELPGRITDVPWAFVYPGDVVGRHPSSLYQSFSEGLVLFTLLWLLRGRSDRLGYLSGAFLAGYGGLRFCTEFFRQPDAHLNFVAFGWMTMGQVLCLPMIAAGVALMVASQYGVLGVPRPLAVAAPPSAGIPSPKATKKHRSKR